MEGLVKASWRSEEEGPEFCYGDPRLTDLHPRAGDEVWHINSSESLPKTNICMPWRVYVIRMVDVQLAASSGVGIVGKVEQRTD